MRLFSGNGEISEMGLGVTMAARETARNHCFPIQIVVTRTSCRRHAVGLPIKYEFNYIKILL